MAPTRLRAVKVRNHSVRGDQGLPCEAVVSIMSIINLSLEIIVTPRSTIPPKRSIDEADDVGIFACDPTFEISPSTWKVSYTRCICKQFQLFNAQEISADARVNAQTSVLRGNGLEDGGSKIDVT